MDSRDRDCTERCASRAHHAEKWAISSCGRDSFAKALIRHARCSACRETQEEAMARNHIASRFDERFEALKQSMKHLVEAGNDTASALKDKMIDVKDSALSGTKSGINRVGGL